MTHGITGLGDPYEYFMLDTITLADGRTVILYAYNDLTQPLGYETQELFIRTLDENGATLSAEIAVGEAGVEANSAQLFLRPDGGFGVAYTSIDNSNFGDAGYVSNKFDYNLALYDEYLNPVDDNHYGHSAVWWSNDIKAEVTDVTSLINGHVVIVGTSETTSAEGRLNVQVVMQDGRPYAEFSIVDGLEMADARVVEMPDGSVNILYLEKDSSSDWHLKMTGWDGPSNPGSALLTPVTIVDSAGLGDPGSSDIPTMDIAVTDDGNILVAYAVTGGNLRVAKVAPDGSVLNNTPVDPAMTLTGVAAQNMQADFVTADDGSILLLYTDPTKLGGVHVQKFNSNGSFDGAAFEIPINAAEYSQAYAFHATALPGGGFNILVSDGNFWTGYYSTLETFGRGTQGDDVEYVWNGTVFDGLGGNDIIIGQDLGELLIGNEGLDTIHGNGGNDQIHLDVIPGSDAAGYFYEYGNSSESAYGGDGADYITSMSGSSFMDGGNGSDVLIGGWGRDIQLGGKGSDFIKGGYGNDEQNGQDGDDTLIGGRGNDIQYGGKGKDELRGGWGDDIQFGENGSDILRGARGADTLDGGNGDDTLHGGLGSDTLTGGDHADTFVFDVVETLVDEDGVIIAQDLVTDFEKGVDTLQFTAGSGVASLADLTITQVDGLATIEWAGGRLIVQLTTEDTLGQNDFAFV